MHHKAMIKSTIDSISNKIFSTLELPKYFNVLDRELAHDNWIASIKPEWRVHKVYVARDVLLHRKNCALFIVSITFCDDIIGCSGPSWLRGVDYAGSPYIEDYIDYNDGDISKKIKDFIFMTTKCVIDHEHLLRVNHNRKWVKNFNWLKNWFNNYIDESGI